MKLEFTIPLPPNRANDRSHWRKVHRDKLNYWAHLDAIQLLNRADLGFYIPKPPAAPLTRAKIRATLFVWSLMDEGNSLARLKWPEDWLVTRGYIRNDTRIVLKWEGIPDQVVDRKHQRVELTLTEAA